MGKDFKNTFSWSVSRDGVFRECARKYYFNYYGHWGGWEKGADARVRQIYILKHLKNRPTWAGEVVHDCIARTLQNLSRGVPILDTAEILSITRNRMRQDFRHSRNKLYRKRPREYCALFEHEYDAEVSDAEWKESAEHVDHCLETFYESEHFERIRALEPHQFLEVEKYSSFFLDGVEIKMKLDCAIKENQQVIVWDWKTGRRELAMGVPLQMACYDYYARQAYRTGTEHVVTREFDLYRGEVHEHRMTDRSLDELRSYIRGSVKDMQGLLDDVGENLAEEDRFAKVEKPDVCLKCKFLKVCLPNLPGTPAAFTPR